MSFLEVALRFKLNVTVAALIKLSEASNTLEIYVEAISVQEMLPLPLDLSLNPAGRRGGAGRPLLSTFKLEMSNWL